jgi:hypothetical protein
MTAWWHGGMVWCGQEEERAYIASVLRKGSKGHERSEVAEAFRGYDD